MGFIKSKFKQTDNESKPEGTSNLAVSYNVKRKGKAMAKGGMAMPDHEEHYASIADAILSKKKAYANGGEVADLEEHSEESPNMADEYNEDANGKEQYDLGQLSPQPKDSNEDGDDQPQEAKSKSMYSKLKRKYNKD